MTPDEAKARLESEWGWQDGRLSDAELEKELTKALDEKPRDFGDYGDYWCTLVAALLELKELRAQQPDPEAASSWEVEGHEDGEEVYGACFEVQRKDWIGPIVYVFSRFGQGGLEVQSEQVELERARALAQRLSRLL